MLGVKIGAKPRKKILVPRNIDFFGGDAAAKCFVNEPCIYVEQAAADARPQRRTCSGHSPVSCVSAGLTVTLCMRDQLDDFICSLITCYLYWYLVDV